MKKRNFGKVEIQSVNSRMRTKCKVCRRFPEGKRVVNTIGSGRNSTVNVYCSSCSCRLFTAFRSGVEALQEEVNDSIVETQT